MTEALPAAAAAPLVEVVRSGVVEGHHHASVVALDASGEVLLELGAGAADRELLPRSCNKPVQALGLLRAGLRLEPELLALASASHSGEEFHLAGVRRILGEAGLTEEALRTPPDLPLDDAERERWLRAGRDRLPIAMNCSGKHAAMLATCARRGWSLEDYLDPAHPVQVAVADAFAEMTGAPATQVAVDGCGAPLLGTTLAGLVGAFRRLALGQDGAGRPDPRVADVARAIREHPAWVSGSSRDELALLRAMPGAIGKAGAEGCYAVALPDGLTVALKIEDGASRARAVLMSAVLELLGLLDRDGVDADGVRAAGRVELLGGGSVVGELRAALPDTPDSQGAHH